MRYLVTRDSEDAGGQVCIWEAGAKVTLTPEGCYIREVAEEEPPLVQLFHVQLKELYRVSLDYEGFKFLNIVVHWLDEGEEPSMNDEKLDMLREALDHFSGPKGVCATLEKVKKQRNKALKLVDNMTERIEHLEDILDDVEFCLSAALNGEEEDE